MPSPYPGRASGVVRIAGQVLSNIVTVASGWGHSHAIRGDGTIAAWGMQFDDSNMVAFPGVSNATSIGGWWTLAAKSDGTLINTFDGKTYDGITNLIAVAAPRADHGNLVGLQRNGVVVDICLGNSPSVTVVASNATAITAGRWQNLALKRDGSVFAWGSQNHVPSGLSNVVAISAGEYHSLALRSDGTVVAWGAIDRPAAHVPEGLTNVVAIAAGNDFSLAITTNAAVAERFRH
jgi:alpha-tubulin suppressor-like RCC1 family protein